jgi:MoaA/NifB/PqqE/SkfB family radical SAM enzyme/Tfp pilus assembly protein PilF
MDDSSKTSLEIGKIYAQQDKFDLAIEQFKKICQSETNNEQAYFELGKAYYLQNKFLEAIEAFKEVGRLNRDNINSLILLAKCYQALGENNLAAQTLKDAANIDIIDDRVHTELFEFFRANKMYDLAIREYEKVLNSGANKMKLMDLLQLYNFEGEYGKIAKKVPPLLTDPSWQEPYLQNRLLNELEISQRRLVLESKPRILLITLSNRCNLNCYMCGRGDSVWEISPVIIEQIIGLLPYLELLTWQGGEVFLVDSFNSLFEKTFGFEYLKQIIITNALLINEEWADRLTRRNNVGLTISIDSVDKKIYEYIRRGASFERLTQNLKIINRARKKYSSNMVTTLRCTIMKANYGQLERFIEFAKDFEFDIIQMAPLSIDGYDPEDIFVHKDLEIIKQISDTMPKIRDLARKYKIKLLDWIPTSVENNNASKKEREPLMEDKSIERKKPLCFRPWKQLAMNVKGYFFPECLCAKPIGDVFHNTLEEIWNSEEMQMYRKKLLENRYTDWCGADCIAGAIPPEHLKFTFA